MTSERVQRQIERLLDEAEQAMAAGEWDIVRLRCEAALALDPANGDARFYLDSAARAGAPAASSGAPPAPAPAAPATSTPAASGPQTFANGRYEVVRFLGEGGRKKVYLARDTVLDRQVAFALIKMEGLDDAARVRIMREAQTMGRLGNHPNLVTVFDIGEHTDEAGVTQPWIAIELLPGGDVEGLLKKAAGPLPLERTLQIGIEVCRGLEFIHGKGVVHRDLKPGNVWLTADGTAKIGDYGLAMSAQNTRLTLQGTMVGTVDYMPPEQALGGDITARSDLYSLGAMLYELVTGRPPFAGDRIAEVISQHINVVPPPPSERGASIPSALDALIVELLAKDPAQRPASAQAVRERLDAIDPHDLPTVFDEDYRLRRARMVFVGRNRELEELKHRFDEAVEGQSRIVMLVGQPGIGKTRLAQELEAYARTGNARVLWGRAPEGGGAPEHWLFTQVLRRFLDEVDESTARRLLGEDAGQLARIAPEIRERLRIEVASGDEFALQEAVRTFIHRLAEERPVLLVLDDLHWADQASLALLQHASRDMARAKVCILGTYRDTELSRTHPLSVALATLNREASFHRIAVRGLDRAQVSAYIERTAGFEPSREQLDLFMRETDGNPFFLSEIVARMLEAGTLNDRTYSLDIPDGMREALARRVNTLSEDAVELLKLAAVVGYEFDFATLSVVSEQPEDRELALIEEALRDHVIAEAERAGSYRFVYEPMQRLLLDELSSTRRLRLHGQIGEQLEASYGATAEQHAAILARHFAESSAITPAHREKALRYCWLAGQQAEAAEESGAAVSWYSRALELVRAGVALRDVGEADALAAWGRSAMSATGGGSAFNAIRDAVELFVRNGQNVDAGRAALAFREMSANIIEDSAPTLTRVIEALGEAEPPLRAALLALRSERTYDERGDADADVAGSLATRHGLMDVEAQLLLREARRSFQTGAHTRAVEFVTRAIEIFRSLGKPQFALAAQLELSQVQLNAGALTDADRTLRDILRARSDANGGFQQAVALGRLAAVLLLRDDAEFDSLVERAHAAGGLIERVLVRRYEARGDLSRALRLAERAMHAAQGSGGEHGVDLAQLARLRYEVGDVDGVREVLPRLLGDLTGSDLQLRVRLANALDVALPGVGEPSSLATIADWRYETDDGSPLAVANINGSFDRTRAMWALALDRLEEAERLVRRGLEWCVRERCPVEEGRCHQLLADVLRRTDRAEEARAHLDAASALFQRHGARLYLDQVLEQRDLLKA